MQNKVQSPQVTTLLHYVDPQVATKPQATLTTTPPDSLSCLLNYLLSKHVNRLCQTQAVSHETGSEVSSSDEVPPKYSPASSPETAFEDDKENNIQSTK